MLRLYTLWELERELSPDEFQHILTPDAALEKAAFTYDLDYRNYVSPPVNEAPNLLSFPKDKPYVCSGYDAVYDALEVNLMEGWIIGLDTDEHWDDTVNPFHINAAGELVLTVLILFAGWSVIFSGLTSSLSITGTARNPQP